MAYIGNQPTSSAFVTDLFSGNGSTTVFTMSVAPANTASILIAISGVVQSPDTYSINATTLTFSAAPPTGTGNISVRYLGIPATNVTTTAYRTVTDFTATASQTTFSVPSYTAGYIDVYRNGARLGAADYTATNGTTVVLANAATVGDLVTTESFYVSSVLNAIPAAAGQVGAVYLANGAASQAFLDVASNTGTGALKLPVGTTAQRPTGATGLIRQNSTTGNPEWWDATTSQWLQFSQPVGYTVFYLLAAGGGGGGTSTANYSSGAGGAGGVINSTATLTSGSSYTVTIGAGAAGLSAGTSTFGNSGTNSTISSIAVALGGGGGGGGTAGAGSSPGQSGGSGGSGLQNAVGGSGTVGQGNAGGTGSGSSPAWGSGGGGGAGAIGSNGTSTTGGAGGVGTIFSITSAYYGGGGGGGVGSTYAAGSGGQGGGGNGGSGATGTNGTANTGGGGGGTGINSVAGSAGGSGIAIIAYYGSQRGTGGTVTTSGGYTIHTFTTSGTYTA
jgi:hypothetical protein